MFDGYTANAYAAAGTPLAKAQAVRDCLGSGTLTVEAIDNTSTVKGIGTFTGPLVANGDGTMSMNVMLTGALAEAISPSAATWKLRIRNSYGTRWIIGSFGPGGRFTLSGATSIGDVLRLNITINLPSVYGLIYPSNNVSGGNIGLDWTGANMVPFYSHTVLWKANYVQQTGYYATSWHCPVNGEFTGGAHSNSGADFIGGHPYPCDGTVDGYGQAQNYGGSFTTHYHELVPWGGSDYIASAGGSALAVTKGVWYWQARTAELISGGTVARFRFWPDVENNPSFVIEQTKSLSELIQSGNALMFRHGCSPWTASGSTNSECLSGTIRHLLQYGRALTAAELPAKFSRTTDDTSDPDIWYSNLNPKPDDVADKSGQGHHPAFANANLPTLYTG